MTTTETTLRWTLRPEAARRDAILAALNAVAPGEYEPASVVCEITHKPTGAKVYVGWESVHHGYNHRRGYPVSDSGAFNAKGFHKALVEKATAVAQAKAAGEAANKAAKAAVERLSTTMQAVGFAQAADFWWQAPEYVAANGVKIKFHVTATQHGLARIEFHEVGLRKGVSSANVGALAPIMAALAALDLDLK